MTDQSGPRKLFRVAPTTKHLQHEIDDEMRFHLQARADDLIRQGYSASDAERISLHEFGDVSAARAELASIDRRRMSKVALREWLSSWLQDLRFATRGLRARPGFSATILLTLALGIGANAAIFSVVDAVLLRPLPFTAPDRLVHLWETFESNVGNRSEASYPDYLDWRARNKVFADLGGYHGGSFLVGGPQPMTVGGARATANFFDALGVHALVGRTFAPGEDAVGAPRVVLLSYGFWQRQFSADPRAIGSSITINGGPATVVGVLPANFRFARQGGAEIWVPIDRPQRTREQRGNHWLNVVGRLKPGATIESASADLSAIMRELAREYPQSNSGRDGKVVSLRDELAGSVRPVLVLLYGAVVVVLLIACVNVANLLLIRLADRQREIAVRVALGAGKARLMRQLLTESLLLAVVGGLLGLVLAWAGVHWLLSLLPEHHLRGLPSLTVAGIDPRIVAYAFVVSLVAGIGFGLVPALRLSGSSVHDTLKSSARGTIAGVSRLRDTLVVGEIALTVILLSGAVLFGRSLLRLMAIDTGFRPEHVVTTSVVFPASRYSTPASQAAVFDRLLDRLHESPTTAVAGITSKLPLDFGNSLGFTIAGQPVPDPSRVPTASYRQVSPDYFRAMGIPVVRGRAFGAGDGPTSPLTAVINRALAAAYFAGVDPVGQRLVLGADTALVVGMVGDVPIGNIDEKIPPTLYLSFARYPQSSMALAIRTTAGPDQVARPLRQVLASVDPGAALTPIVAMDELIGDSPSVFMRRFPLYLVGAFAITALLLAIVGIYGVASYAVAQRTREMGIRMALGARPRSLVGLVMRHSGWMAVAGVTLGVVATLMLGGFAEKLLYGVQPSDPLTYVVVATALLVVALAATISPARRATRVDPAVALRAE